MIISKLQKQIVLWDDVDGLASSLFGLYCENVVKTPKEAFLWYLKSAEQNYAHGLYLVGECYLSAYYVDRNEPFAWEYFSQAAAKGSYAAAVKRALMVENGIVGYSMPGNSQKACDMLHSITNAEAFAVLFSLDLFLCIMAMDLLTTNSKIFAEKLERDEMRCSVDNYKSANWRRTEIIWEEQSD
jgi:hypothetical protein